MSRRDMTTAAFDAALKKHGMERTGFMGYVTVWRGEHGGQSAVYPGNAGSNRRAQLAYLLRAKDQAEREHEELRKAKGITSNTTQGSTTR
jgi:hypothetical protein